MDAELDAQTQSSLRLYFYGTLGMTRECLLKDNITSAETVVRIMFGSMPETFKEAFLSAITLSIQKAIQKISISEMFDESLLSRGKKV